ncbi:patatin-like phospholipase family protein [Rhodobacteraceae bacterium NNCM2]|nr:patatin-like phospholipase family protein [Coraliihabitans acroporae]
MKIIVNLMIVLVIAACSTSIERHPVPVSELSKPYPPAIPNIPNARYWGDVAPPNLEELLTEIAQQRKTSGLNGKMSVLALSGGGDDGAFGAGLLKGWTDLGTRPEFVTITGVSTGALSAPFVFLGPEYDDDLKTLYGGLTPDAYSVQRSIFEILPKASVESSAPLAELIEQYFTKEMFDKIAAEHKRGRRLMIQSTHLDAQRPVIWDLGAIASSGAPNAMAVIRKALLASASIPVAFPPMIVDVEVGNETFDELHVDGGVMSEDTTLTRWEYDLRRDSEKLNLDPAPRTIYVVRNGRIEPEPASTEYSLLGIAGRSVSTLIKSQGVANIVEAYEGAKLIGADFRVTWIGRDFDYPEKEPFASDFMQALYKYGYDLMMSGDAWEERPLMLMSDEERLKSPRGGGAGSDGSS